MKTTNYDVIGLAVPLDATAASVRDGVGETWDPQVTHTPHHWDIRPPLLPASGMPADMAMVRKGRMTVVGVLDTKALGVERGKWAPTIYVCRCTCSAYEGRRGDKLKKASAVEDMCFKCLKLEQLRQRSAKPSTTKSRRKDAAALDRLIGGSR